jgi:hypothetical protein
MCWLASSNFSLTEGGLMEVATKEWKPAQLTAIDVAFGADALKLMPAIFGVAVV